VGLVSRSYQVIGPTLREGTIVYDTLSGLADLPAGWTDRQDAGSYRLDHRSDRALFGYAVGPHSRKRFLHSPIERMWQARGEGDLVVFQADEAAPKLAFIGVRSCEVHANAIQDRVLIDGPYPDAAYRGHYNFIVAVNCGQASGTCFCVSMNTGPKVEAGFDLALTELTNGEDHQFLVEVGSAIGSAVLAELPRGSASPKQLDAADAVVTRTAGQMGRHVGRHLDTNGLKELLQGNPTHKQWDDVTTLDLVPLADEAPAFLPGQFNMLYAFGIGEVAISISGDAERQGRPIPSALTSRGVDE
jgi:sulfhydrogenase subunit beta (sulfur reductase)